MQSSNTRATEKFENVDSSNFRLDGTLITTMASGTNLKCIPPSHEEQKFENVDSGNHSIVDGMLISTMASGTIFVGTARGTAAFSPQHRSFPFPWPKAFDASQEF